MRLKREVDMTKEKESKMEEVGNRGGRKNVRRKEERQEEK